MAAAATPSVPANNMRGANARRYTAERSIKVRMVCKFSAAQFDSMIFTLHCKASDGKRNYFRFGCKLEMPPAKFLIFNF
jgi:hypothetical protein